MIQVKVIVNKLNRRKGPINDFTDRSNIIGSVSNGYLFTSDNQVTNSLGTWYADRDGYYYWGGGVTVLGPVIGVTFNIKNLPVNLPVPCKIGIDISHHNVLPDWRGIKNSGVSFSYIKLSEGVGTPDVKAGEHASIAKQNGFKIGYYHFCRPDTRNGGTVTSDATAEADEALSLISAITKPDLPLVLDLEDNQPWDTPLHPADYLLWINTFINRIKSNSGFDIMLYSRKSYLNEKLPQGHGLGKYKLWIANYSVKDCNRVTCPDGWNDWAIWQYCEDGVIGANAKLDINILKDQTFF